MKSIKLYFQKQSIYVWSVSELGNPMKLLIRNYIRSIIQCFSTVIINGNLSGFWKGKIYTGKSKNLCVPVLNCYSCPGALGACPIGALQVSAGCSLYGISFYVLGFLSLMGVLFGRVICGFLCPFGLIQELLHKIPNHKLRINKKFDRPLRLIKYFILVILVILLPFLAADSYGSTIPFFCKYLCPAGTLEGGIPLISMNKPLQSTIGWLFSWKLFVLAIILMLSILIYRGFCKYLCPLGAFYALFNRFSFYRYIINQNKCTNCGACSNVCKMNVEPVKTPNHSECIRCGSCKRNCPQKAIHLEPIKLFQSEEKNEATNTI